MLPNPEGADLLATAENSVGITVMPGRNGGTLLRGSNFGNRGGGRIKSNVRAMCLEGFAEAVPEVIAIATGKRKKVSAAEQISAFDKLGKHGLGKATILMPDEFVEALVDAVVEEERISAEVAHAFVHSLIAKLKMLQE
jgi:hypothetical protein